MKMILVIDDNRILPELRAAVYVRTSADAISMLEKYRWEEVWFDHDLKGHDTGMLVVDWIERQLRHPRIMRCYIHSMNGYKASQMTKALSRLYPTHRMPLPKSMAIHEKIIEREVAAVARYGKLGHLMAWDHAAHIRAMKDKQMHYNSAMTCIKCHGTMTAYMDTLVADPKLVVRCP